MNNILWRLKSLVHYVTQQSVELIRIYGGQWFFFSLALRQLKNKIKTDSLLYIPRAEREKNKWNSDVNFLLFFLCPFVSLPHPKESLRSPEFVSVCLIFILFSFCYYIHSGKKKPGLKHTEIAVAVHWRHIFSAGGYFCLCTEVARRGWAWKWTLFCFVSLMCGAKNNETHQVPPLNGRRLKSLFFRKRARAPKYPHILP
jgi:hypothetical protein